MDGLGGEIFVSQRARVFAEDFSSPVHGSSEVDAYRLPQTDDLLAILHFSPGFFHMP